MISAVILIILAVVVEVSILPISFFLITCWWLLGTRGLKEAVVAATVGGLVLDVLSPRHLGTSGLVAIMLLLLVEILVGHGRKDWMLAAIGIVGVILEGIIVGRSVVMIVTSLALISVIMVVKELRSSSQGGLVVRREL